ncbi:MAG: hypothetical protein JMM76_00430 [Candidatus Xiphinematobacter sp.]|nr:MAG: hypothetical protein JMM76_00430 [Candidatus Xiphinematobacter sp.]
MRGYTRHGQTIASDSQAWPENFPTPIYTLSFYTISNGQHYCPIGARNYVTQTKGQAFQQLSIAVTSVKRTMSCASPDNLALKAIDSERSKKYGDIAIDTTDSNSSVFGKIKRMCYQALLLPTLSASLYFKRMCYQALLLPTLSASLYLVVWRPALFIYHNESQPRPTLASIVSSSLLYCRGTIWSRYLKFGFGEVRGYFRLAVSFVGWLSAPPASLRAVSSDAISLLMQLSAILEEPS